MSALPPRSAPGAARSAGPDWGGRVAAALAVALVAVSAVLAVRRAGEPGALVAPGPAVAGELQAAPVRVLAGESQGLRARLSPFHADAALQAAFAAAARARLGLGPGAPWRLELAGSLPPPGFAGPAGSAGPDAEGPRVEDGEGTALAPVRPTAAVPGDPLATLWTAREGASVVLWGRPPGSGARLVVDGREVELAPAVVDARELPTSLVRLGGSGDGESEAPGAGRSTRELAAEVRELRAELADERAKRVERERAWYEYNRALARAGVSGPAGRFGVDTGAVPEAGEEPAEADDGEAAPEEPPAPDPERERLEELRSSLRAFLALADLDGYDPIDLGGIVEGGVGPVVFRLLDHRGRLDGSLYAERLRFEGSRAGRTVTLVLEDGYESHGGERVPFRLGERRIPVPFLDPEPWQESCPELFGEGALGEVEDDGLWNREALRRELNRLLALDTSAGWYRFRGIGGVVRTELRDVQIDVLDASGRIERILFADRVRIVEEPPGMALELEDGVFVRGDQKEPFRDGTHTIVLPRARPADWRAASLPGLEDEGGDERQG